MAFRRFFRFFCSLKLAVMVMLTLVGAMTTATFIESIYDTPTAQFWVYRALWFKGVLFLLGVNILCVALDRYPWKARHIPFLMAHAGILTLLFGSWLTDRTGLDGSLRVTEGQSSAVVDLPSLTLVISEKDGKFKTHRIPWTPPGVKFKPMEIPDYGLVVDQFITHAEPKVSFAPAQGGAPAIKVKLSGGPMRTSQEVWLWAGDPTWANQSLGPARFVILPEGSKWDMAQAANSGNSNWLVLIPGKDGSLSYEAISPRTSQNGKIRGRLASGKIQGEVIDPKWKGLTVSILEWIPHAENRTTYGASKIEYGNDAPPPAVHLKALTGGQDSDIWLGLGDRAVLQFAGNEVSIGFFNTRVILPFSVRLERFTIAHNVGTMDPASFESRVTVLDGGKEGREATISMNEPLQMGDVTLYQSSYEDAEPRPTTSIFSVNRDPGRAYKYVGSLLVVLGSILLFVWKAVAKAMMKHSTQKSTKPQAIATGIAMLAFLLPSLMGEAQGSDIAPRQARAGWSFTEAGLIPIQSSGRIKPLDSFAREIALFVTGSKKFEGWEPMDLVFSWMSSPREWEEYPFIQVSRLDVKRQLGLEEARSRFSPRELLGSALPQYASSVTEKPQPGMKPTPREQELKRLLERLGLYRTVVSGEAWLLIPQKSPEPWKMLAQAADVHSNREGEYIRGQFAEMIESYQAGDRAMFERTAVLTKAAVEGEIPEWNENHSRFLVAESFYNRARPFFWAWILYLGASLSWLVGLRRMGGLLTFGAFAVHIGGFALRCYISGRPPVTNMYESLLWVSLGVPVFAGLIYIFNRQTVLWVVACALATLGLVAADVSPTLMDPGINPLVPVLRSNFWLTIHVLTITLGYAAFALSLGISNVTLWKFLRADKGGAILKLNQLTYRAMQFGVVLLAAGTILGGVWADYSWGRFWGWDPKEVWALIALLCYLVILHGRFTGWVGQFGFAAWSIVSFLSVVMAWYGVNFVLGVGLHSYGFSSGGGAAVALFVGTQLAYVGGVACYLRFSSASRA